MKKEFIPFAAIALLMASCSSEDEIGVNPDPAGNALTFSVGVGHSRATETMLTNLGDFNVAAKGVHPHGGVFTNFLIGSKTAAETASRDETETQAVWKLTRDVYWPTSMDDALFWAFTCSQANGGNKSAVLPSGTYDFSATDNVQIKDFSPAKANLKGEPTNGTGNGGIWADGSKQSDLVAAFTQAERSSTTVRLNFSHTLSQIAISANSVNKSQSDHRIVRIKGAWFVNAKDKGTLRSGFDWENNSANENTTWINLSNADVEKKFTAFGSFYKTPKVLEDDSHPEDLLTSSLMLIPQNLTAWDGKALTDNSNNKDQSYILLLCRVELKHDGANHTGGTLDDDIVADDDLDCHYHQLFPVNDSKKFVEGEYGFVCVPVGMNFKMGQRYKFNLDICGSLSGAGIYPPEAVGIDFETLLPTDKDFVTNWGTSTTLSVVKRNVKKVGDPVLDEPIKFSVEVSAWTAEGDAEWNEGTVIANGDSNSGTGTGTGSGSN